MVIEKTYSVPDISCDHCVNAITKATTDIGVDSVTVDIPTKQVQVRFDPAKISEDAVKESIIEDAGYDIAAEVR